MINLRVVTIKDIIKNLVKFIAIIIFVIFITRFFGFMSKVNITEYIKNKINSLEGKTFIECINDNVSIYNGSGISNNDKLLKNKKSSTLKNEDIFTRIKNVIFLNFDVTTVSRVLNNEFSVFGYIDNNSTNNVDTKKNKDKTNEEEVRIAKKGNSSTEVIKKNNKDEVYNKVYDGVKIKNESKYKLTRDDLKPNIDFKNKKDIVIYHTHTCESYTKTEKYKYKATGNYRTTDLNYSVARVGTELTKYLEKYKFSVIHSKTYHDYPQYNGSYARSLDTVSRIMKKSNASFVIDLHRDALGSNSHYGPSVKINGEEAAQLMFVIGTNGGGRSHSNWKKNLKLAIKVQKKANEMYPGLFKPIIVRNSRYNQHVSDGACIIEVGATGNTLEQCLTSMKYLSAVIDEVMNK